MHRQQPIGQWLELVYPTLGIEVSEIAVTAVVTHAELVGPVSDKDVGDVANLIDGVRQCYLVEQKPQAIADGLVRALKQKERSNGRAKMHEYDMIHATEQVYAIYLEILKQT